MPTLTHLLNTIANSPDYAGISRTVRGIEKESLRITPDGTLALSDHPKALGSALTHPLITTDYSEALLEFITAPDASMDTVLQQLHNIHAYTYKNMGDERLWVSSMPCILGKDSDIPIAKYGSSNSGTMKSVYRRGLGHRYGRSMQTISGIHYNFSVSDNLWLFLKEQENSPLALKDFKTQGYFRLIRNFRRYFWLLLYLFGSSPSVCKTFLGDKPHNLHAFDDNAHSLFTPHATSLRMGDLGYQSNAQESLVITYNCLQTYIDTLCHAITQTHSDYQDIGIKDEHGLHKQLNDSLLQIENEFYSVIRPKRTSQSGETALSALVNGGIEYIEVRCLDLNPYEPVGINKQQMQFIDTFLLYCLLSDSPMSDETEYQHIQENQKRMVYHGRDPELKLYDQNSERSMRDWGQEIMSELNNIAHVLDQASQSDDYTQSVSMEIDKLVDASLTPSARILSDMKEQQLSFYQLSMKLSEQHQAFFLQKNVDDLQSYLEMAKQSLQEQTHIEQSDTIDFDQFLAEYYAQYHCANKTVSAE